MRNEGQIVCLCLSDQHAIERISMVKREPGRSLGMSERDEELLEAASEHACFHAVREIEASQSRFDRGLPGGSDADKDLICSRDAATHGGGDLRGLAPPPEEDVRIEEQAAGRAHPGPSKASWISGGRGASKSSAMRMRPSQPPGWRGKEG